MEGASAFVPQTLSTEAHRYQSLPSKMKYHQRYLRLGDHAGIISWYFNVFHMFPGMDYLWLSSKKFRNSWSFYPIPAASCSRGLSEKLKISRWNCSQCLILEGRFHRINQCSVDDWNRHWVPPKTCALSWPGAFPSKVRGKGWRERSRSGIWFKRYG